MNLLKTGIIRKDSNTTLVKVKFQGEADVTYGGLFKYNTC